MEHEAIREQILRILYGHQEEFPRSNGLYEAQITSRIGGVDISFALFYLEKKQHIEVTGRYIRITAGGIDALERIDRQRLLDMGK